MTPGQLGHPWSFRSLLHGFPYPAGHRPGLGGGAGRGAAADPPGAAGAGGPGRQRPPRGTHGHTPGPHRPQAAHGANDPRLPPETRNQSPAGPAPGGPPESRLPELSPVAHPRAVRRIVRAGPGRTGPGPGLAHRPGLHHRPRGAGRADPHLLGNRGPGGAGLPDPDPGLPVPGPDLPRQRLRPQHPGHPGRSGGRPGVAPQLPPPDPEHRDPARHHRRLRQPHPRPR